MKVLLLSRYGRLGASSRVRFYQYIPYLESQGVEVTVLPLVGDRYLERLYGEGRKDSLALISGCLARVRDLLRVQRYDLVWLEGELLPWLPAWGEQLIAGFGVRMVVDYDDAIFHRYDRHGSPLVRALLARKIDRVMRSAALVLAGNEYLADRARRAGADRVEILPTVVDLAQYPAPPPQSDARPFTIGWIGSPATASYLELIRRPLEALGAEPGTRISLVGLDAAPAWNVPVELHRWSEDTESRCIAEFDVGIMPLRDGPWERGKCGYKLIQYMATGKPVVASPVGVNGQIVRHGENGFLANDSGDWIESIARLRGDADLRRRMGEVGREQVEQCYSVQATAPRLLSLLRSCARIRDGRAARAHPVRERKTECVNLP